MVDIRHFEYFIGSGAAVVGATVNLRAASLTQPNVTAIVASTTTNASGLWSFTGLAVGDYDVEITYSGRKRKQFGLSINPLGFDLTNADVHASAGIELTKLDDGSPLNEDRDPTTAATATTAKDTIEFILSQIKDINGTAAWNTVPPTNLATTSGKFHATTGHKHTGAGTDAPNLDATSIVAATAYNEDRNPVTFVPANVKEMLETIISQIKDGFGGTFWNSAPASTLATIWGKFHATTGHAHSGAANDAPILEPTNVAPGSSLNEDRDPAVFAPANFKERLEQVISQIKDLNGTAAWNTAPASTITALFAKFHATTGHAHSGAAGDAPLLGAGALATDSVGTDEIAAGAVGNAEVNASAAIEPTKFAVGSPLNEDRNPVTFTPANLKEMVEMIISQIKDGFGGTNWNSAPATTIATLWGKFNATTGHTHTGAANDAPKIGIGAFAAASIPIAKCYRFTTQNINTTTAVISFDVEQIDTDSMYDAAVPGRITVTTPGYYRFTTRVYAQTKSNVSSGGFLHNGATFHQFWVDDNSGDGFINGTTILPVAAADYVQVRFTTSASVDFSTGNLGWFEAEWLGPL